MPLIDPHQTLACTKTHCMVSWARAHNKRPHINRAFYTLHLQLWCLPIVAQLGFARTHVLRVCALRA